MKTSNARARSKLFGKWLLIFVVLLIVSEFIVAVINNVLADTELVAYSYTLIVMPVISLIFTGLMIFMVRNTQIKTHVLIENMERVAHGDYGAEIEDSHAGAFAGVYENFNKMTKELSSVKSLREEFVHSLSHEFKTPLCSIQGFAQLLSEGCTEPEEAKKYLKIIADEAERLRRLAEGVLTLSKLENMQFIGESTKFRLDMQIRDCVISCEREWTKKKLDMDLQLSAVEIEGDETLLRHVWTNLVSNAVKFSKEGGRVEISLKKENGFAAVRVKDFGEGIEEEAQSKIFDKYYRAPSAKGVEGSGLGLAICKRICTLSDGNISCFSVKGEGSEFTVRLPLKN